MIKSDTKTNFKDSDQVFYLVTKNHIHYRKNGFTAHKSHIIKKSDELQKKEKDLAKAKERELEELSKISKMTVEQAKTEMMQKLQDDMKQEMAGFIRSEQDKAKEIVEQLSQKYEEYLKYYAAMNPQEQSRYAYEIIENLQSLQRMIQISQAHDQALAQAIDKRLMAFESVFKRYLDALSAQQKENQIIEQRMRAQDSVDLLNVDTTIIP